MLVDCDYKKWGDVQHWRFTLDLLGTDEHGTWLGSPAPVAYDGPRGIGAFAHTFVLLVPENRWWTATFNDHDTELYADITTPPAWPDPTHMTCTDLDLDVIRMRDGTVILDDTDEFDEHRVAFAYPDDIIANARASAAWLMEAVAERREPFGEAGLRWLERVAKQ